MGKRSDFERNPRDFYVTPHEGVIPLLPHLKPSTIYCEPCAGDGSLVRHLEKHGHICTRAIDIEPLAIWIEQKDALKTFTVDIDCFITNPPWDRKILHPLINHLRVQAPTWLLFDSDWAYTKQSSPYMKYCSKIIAVGRLKWIKETAFTGKDNCSWYLFLRDETSTAFIGK